MNKELKEKWLVALRSGKYTQGKECLSDGKNHCCLGVLCEVAGLKKYEPRRVLGHSDDERKQVAYQHEKNTTEGLLPESFRHEAEIPYDEMDELSCYNDEGKSFEWIADYIERNL